MRVTLLAASMICVSGLPLSAQTAKMDGDAASLVTVALNPASETPWTRAEAVIVEPADGDPVRATELKPQVKLTTLKVKATRLEPLKTANTQARAIERAGSRIAQITQADLHEAKMEPAPCALAADRLCAAEQDGPGSRARADGGHALHRIALARSRHQRSRHQPDGLEAGLVRALDDDVATDERQARLSDRCRHLLSRRRRTAPRTQGRRHRRLEAPCRHREGDPRPARGPRLRQQPWQAWRPQGRHQPVRPRQHRRLCLAGISPVRSCYPPPSHRQRRAPSLPAPGERVECCHARTPIPLPRGRGWLAGLPRAGWGDRTPSGRAA